MGLQHSQNQDRIIAAVGADDWEMVICTFAGLKKKDVLDILNEIIPQDNNSPLATLIAKEMPGYVSTKQAAAFVDLTDVSIRKRCAKEEKELRAKKINGYWYLPADVARNLKRIRTHKNK
jgi:hypothetical protein